MQEQEFDVTSLPCAAPTATVILAVAWLRIVEPPHAGYRSQADGAIDGDDWTRWHTSWPGWRCMVDARAHDRERAIAIIDVSGTCSIQVCRSYNMETVTGIEETVGKDAGVKCTLKHQRSRERQQCFASIFRGRGQERPIATRIFLQRTALDLGFSGRAARDQPLQAEHGPCRQRGLAQKRAPSDVGHEKVSSSKSA
jgi:hypothetical protein